MADPRHPRHFTDDFKRHKIELVEVDSTWILSHPLDVEDLLSKYRKG